MVHEYKLIIESIIADVRNYLQKFCVTPPDHPVIFRLQTMGLGLIPFSTVTSE